jgi:hypothetical protein
LKYFIYYYRDIIESLELSEQDKPYCSGNFALLKIPLGEEQIGFLSSRPVFSRNADDGVSLTLEYVNQETKDEYDHKMFLDVHVQSDSCLEKNGHFSLWASKNHQGAVASDRAEVELEELRVEQRIETISDPLHILESLGGLEYNHDSTRPPKLKCRLCSCYSSMYCPKCTSSFITNPTDIYAVCGANSANKCCYLHQHQCTLAGVKSLL